MTTGKQSVNIKCYINVHFRKIIHSLHNINKFGYLFGYKLGWLLQGTLVNLMVNIIEHFRVRISDIYVIQQVATISINYSQISSINTWMYVRVIKVTQPELLKWDPLY